MVPRKKIVIGLDELSEIDFILECEKKRFQISGTILENLILEYVRQVKREEAILN